MSDPYWDVVAAKIADPPRAGLTATPEMSANLRTYQKESTAFGLRIARWGLFLDTGLGKTLIEHEWGMHAAEASNGKTLILCPLAVAQQQRREAERFGYSARVIREQSDAGLGLNICNYDRLHLLRPEEFGAVVLDESSVLKSFTGKVSQVLRAAFAGHRWRMIATATPAPNDHMELGQSAEFLGIMPANEMLMRWFINDQTGIGKYRLRGWGELPFWDWMASWSLMAGHPRDLGHPEEGFELQPMEIIRHRAESGVTMPGTLFGGLAVSATEIHTLKRQTAAGRAATIRAAVEAEPGEPWVLWVDTDYEADALSAELRKLDPTRVVEVRGSMTADLKEERLGRFATGEPLWLVTKPSIAGWGLNWQHCARMAFLGRNYSYESWYQAVRRSWRYGQTRPVKVHLAIAEGEEVIGRALDRKAEDQRKMQTAMAAATRRRTLAPEVSIAPYEAAHVATAPEWLGGGEVRCLGATAGNSFALFHGDCVDVLRQLPDACVDVAVYSPPFSGLYIYSDSAADMGNCADDEEFLRQYRFLCEELYRVLRPGRLALVHCKHLVYYQNACGTAGLRDLPGKLIEVHQSAGFDLHGPPITIWRSPVREMTKTKARGLLYKQLRADSTFSRMGLPEYILPLRRWPTTEAEEALVVPVTHTHESFPLERWQRWAEPVWGWGDDELRETNVLQASREARDEKHICPMPLDIIGRCVTMWSNPGETVLSPFAGIGSELWQAMRLHRRAVGVELKESYYRQAAEYLDGPDRQATLLPGEPGPAPAAEGWEFRRHQEQGTGVRVLEVSELPGEETGS